MDNLPRSVREILALIGLAPALALVQAYGGCILRVPTGAHADGQVRARLIGLLGGDAADVFIAHYGGERLSIPRCAAALRDERDAMIIAAYTSGRAVPTLAREHALTERQIRNILKRVPGESGGFGRRGADEAQIPLF